jgi:hypothetical protein
MSSEAVETVARVFRATTCGHPARRGARGPAPTLCARCRRRAALATRLRQALKIADELGLVVLALELHRQADAIDPRRT